MKVNIKLQINRFLRFFIDADSMKKTESDELIDLIEGISKKYGYKELGIIVAYVAFGEHYNPGNKSRVYIQNQARRLKTQIGELEKEIERNPRLIREKKEELEIKSGLLRGIKTHVHSNLRSSLYAYIDTYPKLDDTVFESIGKITAETLSSWRGITETRSFLYNALCREFDNKNIRKI